MRSFAVVAALLLVACKGSGSSPSAGSGSATATTPAGPVIPGVELPELAGAGTDAIEANHPLLTASLTELVLKGDKVIMLQDGKVDASEKEGGALGIKVPRLTAKLAAVGGSEGTLDLALDRRTSFELLFQILFSAKQKEAGWKRFNILARAGGTLVVVPLRLPDRDASPSVSEMDIAKLVETLDPDSMLETIQSTYLPGIKRCYKDVLEKNPKASGSVKLTLPVTAKGALNGATATGPGLGKAFETCVEKAMTQWTFSIPKDDAGQPTDATFTIKLQFASDDADALPSAPAAIIPEPGPSLAGPEHDDPISPVVSVSATELILWSLSGLEGTLQQPKLRVLRSSPTAVDDVSKALAEIVERRWGDKTRPETTHEIIVMADRATQMQAVVEILAAVRATPDGKVLFRDVLLSPGFE